ncbi:hypothetical protein [Saprospira grandis]|uniref:hypothetical protein n=1 Tax=Saprospira grandis TaxID=1008 RepID=UPI0022DDA8E4|nr:hypothetical protein [Saprospira grandis]WBM74090.1 hypothetical protein OP864_13970 [Saprospira grandis]
MDLDMKSMFMYYAIIIIFILAASSLYAQEDSCFIENYKKRPEHAEMFGFENRAVFILELGHLLKCDKKVKKELSEDLKEGIRLKVFLNKSLTEVDSVQVHGLRLSPKKLRRLLRRTRKKAKVIRTCLAVNYYATEPSPPSMNITTTKSILLVFAK